MVAKVSLQFATAARHIPVAFDSLAFVDIQLARILGQ